MTAPPPGGAATATGVRGADLAHGPGHRPGRRPEYVPGGPAEEHGLAGGRPAADVPRDALAVEPAPYARIAVPPPARPPTIPQSATPSRPPGSSTGPRSPPAAVSRRTSGLPRTLGPRAAGGCPRIYARRSFPRTDQVLGQTRGFARVDDMFCYARKPYQKRSTRNAAASFPQTRARQMRPASPRRLMRPLRGTSQHIMQNQSGKRRRAASGRRLVAARRVDARLFGGAGPPSPTRGRRNARAQIQIHDLAV